MAKTAVKVLLAGASGDLGAKIAELLIAADHEVLGLTRSESKGTQLAGNGIRPVIGDLLDPRSTRTAVEKIQPDVVVQVPIALPERGPLRPSDLRATNRLRNEGTRNLLEASLAVQVKRYVAESIVAIYGYGDIGEHELDEDSATAKTAPFRALQPALDALEAEETMVLDAARAERIEGIVVRLGFYYGAGVGSTRYMATLLRRGLMPVTKRPGAMPWVELSDGAAGVVAALQRGRSGEIYNIVGDRSAGLTELARELLRQLGTRPPRELPAWVIRLGGRYAALMGETNLHVSNRKAKQELGWSPGYPTIQDGVNAALPSLGLN